MERIHCNYRYTPLREGMRGIYKNDGSFPPKMPEGEDVEDALFLTASRRNYHMVTMGDIRVLLLLPGSFDDPLQCRLTIKPIEQHPTYDTLSYMWGDPSDTRLITVDGDQAFPVTVSLENALQHIRLQNKIRNLWVDAVCINQGDIKERGSQVNLMKEIYSRARLSTVWIDIELSPDNPCVRRLLSLEEDTALDDIGDDPKFWEPLIPLLQNPYWERLWVQQELVFAPSLHWGPYPSSVLILEATDIAPELARQVLAGESEVLHRYSHSSYSGCYAVGKTLTAELLAEHLQKALMPVSAGELGTTAQAVEERLSRILNRATRWKAVLLLDEADVLLEQRSVKDIHRNALVCVFLRTREYYQGMMFLTTNRVSQIDDAIASRIHFKLKYDNLNREQRINIWRAFLGKAVTPQGAPICSRKAFDSLVGKERNGREIKNLVSTAHALAAQEGCQVTISHLEVAITACEDFECDFKGAGPTEAMNSYH